MSTKSRRNNPYFSIIIPTYNRGDLIKATLKSLKDQSFDDFEVLIIDDGGHDDTEGVVASFNDSRFFYTWKKNEERAVARNTGTHLSKGKYLNFFDSDDVAYPHHLQTAYEFIQNQNNPEVFHLAYDFKSPNGAFLKSMDQFPTLANKILAHGNSLSCNGVFIREDVAKTYLFNSDRALSASEDYELWMRLACRFPFHSINTVTTSIIDHEFRSVVKIDKRKLIKRKELFLKYLQEDKLFMEKYGKYLLKMKSDSYTYIALHLAIAGYEVSESIFYLKKALKLRPAVITERRFLGTLKTIFKRKWKKF